MALINPSNLYSEGQVNLDSTPYLRMQQQQQAKQQAREDALYKYFSELPNKLNAAGMRVQDIDGAAGGFNKKLQNVRSFWHGLFYFAVGWLLSYLLALIAATPAFENV